MATCCGHFQGAPGHGLTTYISQVRHIPGPEFQWRRRYRGQWRSPGQVLAYLQQVTGRQHIVPSGKGGFVPVVMGNQHSSPGIAGSHHRRQDAFQGTQGAVERQLSDAFTALQAVRRELA